MDVSKTIKLRRSIRDYCDKPIPKKIICELIDAARYAPTARNIQPWEFVVVADKQLLGKIANLAQNGRFISQAAVCIAVFCLDTKYYLEDGCAATVNVLLAAANRGIGSCWVAGDKKDYADTVKGLLHIPANFKLVSLVALGYPKAKGSFKAVPKKSVEELLHWEKF